ncbi:MAG: hypothetical protein NZ937_09610, partial [Armatimonadetes bacterium]|nr:hypothetical protein [Armatimonadota bacterium]
RRLQIRHQPLAKASGMANRAPTNFVAKSVDAKLSTASAPSAVSKQTAPCSKVCWFNLLLIQSQGRIMSD